MKADPAITRLGRFSDLQAEREYEAATLGGLKKDFRQIILVLAVVLALFLVPDFLSNRDANVLSRIVTVRATCFAWLLVMYLMMPRIHSYRMYTSCLFLSETMASMGILYIASLYEHPDFMLQLMSVVLVVFAFYVIPGRFELMLVSTVILWLFFLFVAMNRFHDVEMKEWAAAILLPAVFATVAVSFHLRLEKEKRGQFALNHKLKELAWKDPLTDSYNRLKFDADLDDMLVRANAGRGAFAVVLADVDDFKRINDQHGHLVGDEVLMKLAGVFRQEVRKQDIVARWGGEEFVVLFPGATQEEAFAITTRMKQAVEHAEYPHGLHITCSFGVSVWQESDDARVLVNRADRYLYQAKDQGKNRIVCSAL